MATTPSAGTLNGREPGGTTAGVGDGLPDAVGLVGSLPGCDPDGEPLGVPSVVPNGVGERAGVAVVPGMGVDVPGTGVGLGVGLVVGLGVGGGVGACVGVGAGVGVGAVTTTGFGAFVLGVLPALVVALKTTDHVPTGSVDDPVHVPESRGSVVDIETIRVVKPLEAVAVTVTAVSVMLPRYSTLNRN